MTTRFIDEDFSQGVVNSRDASGLNPGELQKAENCVYKPGDPKRLHKQKGRTAFADTTSAAKVKGVGLLRYDSGLDWVVALSGTTLYSAQASRTAATFASLKTGLGSDSKKISYAHSNDKHYLCTDSSADKLIAIEEGTVSAGPTVYDAGLKAPLTPMVATTVSTGALRYATSNSDTLFTGGSTNDANAYDGLKNTYAYIEAGADTTEYGEVYSFANFAPVAGRTAFISFALYGSDVTEPGKFPEFDVGATTRDGFKVYVEMWISEDSGVTYTKFIQLQCDSSLSRRSIQVPISAGTDESTLRLKVLLHRRAGSSLTDRVALAIYHVRVYSGSPPGSSTTTTGMRYAYTEYDSLRGEESSLSSESALINVTNKGGQFFTLQSTAANTRTTHYRIYRTQDGGTYPRDLGLIGIIDVGQTVFLDDFGEYDVDEVPVRLADVLIINTDQAQLFFQKNVAPPALKKVTTYQGSLVGILATNSRSLHYSIPGLPGSWPTIYVITSFPFEEHDTLENLLDMGDLLILGARNAMGRINVLPRAVHGSFDQSRVEKIQGAPGCVGGYAMTKYSSDGQPFCAWISDYGIYVTNGSQYFNISRSIDWTVFEGFDKSAWALSWDPLYQVITMDYSSTGATVNNRYLFLHMAPEHQRQDKQPKVTYGHYGEASNRAIGQVSNTRTIYTAHADDGKVYMEDNGGTDPSLAYDANGTWPMVVKSRRIHGSDYKFSVLSSRLRHSDFGAGETTAVVWTAGGEDDTRTQTRSLTAKLSEVAGGQFGVLLGGLWHEYELTHTGAAVGAFLELRHRVRRVGTQGKVEIA